MGGFTKIEHGDQHNNRGKIVVQGKIPEKKRERSEHRGCGGWETSSVPGVRKRKENHQALSWWVRLPQRA